MNYTISSTNNDFEVKYNCNGPCYCSGKCKEPIIGSLGLTDPPHKTSDSREQSKSTADLIIEECEDIKNTLLEKNRKYGDSATRRGDVFGLPPVVAIKARIEDKLNRLKNDNNDEDEDITKDLLGYFILLRIAIKQEKA